MAEIIKVQERQEVRKSSLARYKENVMAIVYGHKSSFTGKKAGATRYQVKVAPAVANATREASGAIRKADELVMRVKGGEYGEQIKKELAEFTDRISHNFGVRKISIPVSKGLSENDLGKVTRAISELDARILIVGEKHGEMSVSELIKRLVDTGKVKKVLLEASKEGEIKKGFFGLRNFKQVEDDSAIFNSSGNLDRPFRMTEFKGELLKKYEEIAKYTLDKGVRVFGFDVNVNPERLSKTNFNIELEKERLEHWGSYIAKNHVEEGGLTLILVGNMHVHTDEAFASKKLKDSVNGMAKFAETYAAWNLVPCLAREGVTTDKIITVDTVS